jgi:CDP-ribitol ribitolphosphotransferase
LQEKLKELIANIDFSRYNLVVKPHPLSQIRVDDERVISGDLFESIDMIMACDYVIVDYSAIIFEAALLKKPMYFYAFDYDEYTSARGFFIDYMAEIPGAILRAGGEVALQIEAGRANYDEKKAEAFLRRYVDVDIKDCTGRIVEFISGTVGS